MSLFSNEKEKVYDQYSDVIKWINAATLVYPEADKWFQENLTSETIKNAAEYVTEWEIIDKDTADQLMSNLYYGGGNFKNYQMKIGSLIDEMRGKQRQNKKNNRIKKILKKSALIYIQQKYPEIGIIASDLTKGIYLASRLYLVGIYSFEEAMSASVKMAQKLQKYFNSWDECMDNLFWGIQCEDGESVYDPDSHLVQKRRLYNKLKKQKNGTYAIEWKMPLIDNSNASTIIYPDTVKWINATKAYYNVVNQVTPHLFWPAFGKESIITFLFNVWGIEKREQAHEVIKNLWDPDIDGFLFEEWRYMNGMTLAEYIEYKSNHKNLDFELENKPDDYHERRFRLLHAIMNSYSKQGNLARHMFTVIQSASMFHLAGYYSYKESLNTCLKAAKKIQENFTSWDEYIDSYFLSEQLCSDDILENPLEYVDLEDGELLNFKNKGTLFRLKIYEWLKREPDSVYNIPWNTELKKEW
ncbi:DUF1266 domain-containing protein [Flavobacterium tyrosinilyticum]|uniref:DUF1266 domain-containing protein n=1 Tax=Flavobacterium tyrosinilyticum TaxID=1658740 RepID=UPI002030C6E2|nr:DUF1266 domain-containing protein [Flavobacterium tyrosinilyticum]MCM0665443.1 DUF1266 domain-containing protein [Flavobacterium tyrosinilyticum]